MKKKLDFLYFSDIVIQKKKTLHPKDFNEGKWVKEKYFKMVVK